MKKIYLPLVVAVGAFTCNLLAQTNAQTESPRVFLAQTNHLKATVEDIDYAKREITLKGPEGRSARFAVSDSVKNFPQMKKGDEVNVGYYESIALAIAKPGETLSATSRSQALATREPGQRPGAAAVSITDTTATIEDIDRDKREVTLRTQDGDLVKVWVDPSVGNLQRIKKGDQITATRTQALAVSVDEPNSKSGTTDSEPK
jgi:Cu/Ag efflux protein CusF